jgi:acylphosphatase
MKVRAHLLIDGRVQGVYYRAFTREVAYLQGLAGWSKNLPDGRVEVVFEGEKDKIEAAIRHCYEGTPFSRVTNIETTWENKLEGLTDFTIRYWD